jgi:hypothetical protein
MKMRNRNLFSCSLCRVTSAALRPNHRLHAPTSQREWIDPNLRNARVFWYSPL